MSYFRTRNVYQCHSEMTCWCFKGIFLAIFTYMTAAAPESSGRALLPRHSASVAYHGLIKPITVVMKQNISHYYSYMIIFRKKWQTQEDHAEKWPSTTTIIISVIITTQEFMNGLSWTLQSRGHAGSNTVVFSPTYSESIN